MSVDKENSLTFSGNALTDCEVDPLTRELVQGISEKCLMPFMEVARKEADASCNTDKKRDVHLV